MALAYTPTEMATALAHFERMIQRQRAAQHRYYERNTEAKKAYAKEYYRRKKAERMAQLETPAEPAVVPDAPAM